MDIFDFEDKLNDMETKINENVEIILEIMLDKIIDHLVNKKIVKKSEKPIDIEKINRQMERIYKFKGVQTIIDDYMEVLKKVMLGFFDQEELDQFGITGLNRTSSFYHIYNNSTNYQRDSFKEALSLGKIPLPISEYRNKMIAISLQKAGNEVDKKIVDMKNDIIQSLTEQINNTNNSSLQRLLDEDRSTLQKQVNTTEKRREIIKDALNGAFERRTSTTKAKQIMKDVIKDYSVDYDRIIRTESQKIRHEATVNTINEIQKEKQVVVCIVNIDDHRVSKECKDWSRDGSNKLKYFYLKDLKPSGFNLDKKRKDWQNSIPPRHFNCRCALVYVPNGFKCDKYGSLTSLEVGEELKIEEN